MGGEGFITSPDIRSPASPKPAMEGKLIWLSPFHQGFPGWLYKDRVETENANNPHGEGPIDPNNFAPFPKNPTIAKFFIQLGRVDELGSGVLNVNKFIKKYSGRPNPPQFIEGNTFKTIIPINESISEGLNEGLKVRSEGLNEGLKSLFRTIAENPGIPAKKISPLLENRPIKTIERQIKELIELDLVERKGSRKTGGYFVTKN